jgi:TonB-linked SusC/RagA family outer membrane protein
MLHRLLKQSGRGLAIAALTLFVATPLLAQTGRIEGTVRDANSDDPVAGARVTVVGTQMSAETNENGYYAIQEVPVGTYEVRVSVIGYQTVTITNQRVQGGLPTTVNFSLARSILRIEGVVVTGVAEATEAVKLPFTVDQVKGEDLPVPASNPEEMIRGKVAGATVVRPSGRPGTGVSVLLRGATSFTRSNEPLYVVDGVILGASMVDIDALDIDNIEVVKGAAAAALYGSRAANGVVSITTRRGADLPEGETRVTVRSEFGTNNLEQPVALTQSTHYKTSPQGWLDATDALIATADTTFECDLRAAGGGAPCAADGSEERPIDVAVTVDNGLFISTQRDQRVIDWVQSCFDFDANGNDIRDAGGNCQPSQYAVSDNPYPTSTPSFDHFDRFIDPGQFYTNSLSVSHRTGATNFLASFSETREPGILIGLDGYLRRSGRVNIDHKIGSQLDFRASAFYSQSQSDLASDDFDDVPNPFFSLVRLEPDVDLLQRYPRSQAAVDAGVATARDSNDYIVKIPLTLEENPIYSALNQEDDFRRGRFLGNLGLRWRPIELVDLEANFSFDRSDRQLSQFWFVGYRTIDPNDVGGGRLRKNSSFDEAINGALTATLSRDFGDLGTITKARILMERQRGESVTARATGLLVNDVKDLDNSSAGDAASQRIFGSTYEIRSLGYFLSTQWDFKDRYIVDALIRRDGSSLFGADERWNWYYRASAAYRMSEEPWWPFDFLDEFKFRFSRGTAGNRPAFNAQYETFNIGAAGVTKGNLGNKLLKPELAAETEIGVDLIAAGRISLQVTRAATTIEDQLIQVPLAGLFGFGSQWQNAGTISTNTWEATLQVAAVQTPDLSWNWNFVWDRTRGNIDALSRSAFFVPGTGGYWFASEGDELGTIYGTHWATQCSDIKFGGTDPATGNPIANGFYSGNDCLVSNGGAFEVNDDGYLVPVGTGNTWTDGITENYYGSTVTIDGRSYAFGIPVKGEIVKIDTLGFLADGSAIEQTDTTIFQSIGNTIPDFNFGISQTIRWKGLQLYALVDGQIGGQVYNFTRQWGCRDLTCWEHDQRTQSGELGSGDGSVENTKKPTTYVDVLYDATDLNDHYMEDGGFVKLREVSLRYTIGRGPLSGILGGLMKRVSFNLIGRNLMTFTGYTGTDPEVSNQGGNSSLLRVDSFGYPNYRTFTGSIEIEF